MLTVGSLFAGIGGGELGLEQTGGFKTIWSVENDKDCNESRKRSWPDVPQYGDIRECFGAGTEYDYAVSGRFGEFLRFNPLSPWIALKHSLPYVDVIIGGSPCQDLSCAGKRAGLAGERSSLFYEFIRVVGELQPRWVIWENVRGAFSSNGGRDFLAILYAFHNAGYDAEWCCLRASDFGYPHGRARVFVVAYRRFGKRCSGQEYRQRPASGEQGQPAFAGQGVAIANEQGLSLSKRKSEPPRSTAEPSQELENPARDVWRRSHRQTRWPWWRGVCLAGKRLGGELVHPGRMLRRPHDDQTGIQPAGAHIEGEADCWAGNANQIPFAPPGLGLTESLVKNIIKLYNEEPKKAKAIFEAEREQTERWAEILEDFPWLAPAVEPGLCRMVDGLPSLLDAFPEGDEEPHIEGEFNRPRVGREIVIDANRAKRLRALGNAIVPACAQWIGEQILRASAK